MTDAELEAFRVVNERRKALKAAARAGTFFSDNFVSTATPEEEADFRFVMASRYDPVEEQVDALLAEVQRLRSCYESDNDDVYISRLRDRGYEVSDPHE